MKQTAMYLCLFIKRVLKRPVFLILMFLIPFISIWLKNVFTIDNINLKVALYTDDSTGIAYKSVKALVNTDDTISFVQCKSEEQLKELVSSGSCQCGYIIPAGLEKKFDNNAFRHSIRVVRGTFTISPVTNEIVFSEIFNNYVVHVLKKYLKDNGLFKNRVLSDIYNETDAIYNEYMKGNESYSFEYNNEEIISHDNSILLPGYLILSVRGILSVIIFVCALASGMQLYADNSNNIFRTLHGFRLYAARYMDILAITFVTGLFCFAGVLLSGSVNILYEIVAITAYILIASLVAFILCSIIKSKSLYCCIIPAIIILCLIICPVFIDISDFNSSFAPIQYLFAPTWYLKLFSA